MHSFVVHCIECSATCAAVASYTSLCLAAVYLWRNRYYYVAAPPSVTAFDRVMIMVKPEGVLSRFLWGCFWSALAGAGVGLAVVVAVKIVIAVLAAPSATAGPAGVATLHVATLAAAITAIVNIVLKHLE